jgi:hypothetical protein
MRHEELEVAWRKVEIQVELAEVLEVVQVDGFETSVERLDNPGAHAATPPVCPPDHAQIGQLPRVLLEDRGCGVGGAVVDHDPERRRHALPRHALRRTTHVFRLVAAGRQEDVAGLAVQDHWPRLADRVVLLRTPA